MDNLLLLVVLSAAPADNLSRPVSAVVDQANMVELVWLLVEKSTMVV